MGRRRSSALDESSSAEQDLLFSLFRKLCGSEEPAPCPSQPPAPTSPTTPTASWHSCSTWSIRCRTDQHAGQLDRGRPEAGVTAPLTAVKRRYGHPQLHLTAVGAQTIPNRSRRFGFPGLVLRSHRKERSRRDPISGSAPWEPFFHACCLRPVAAFSNGKLTAYAERGTFEDSERRGRVME